MRVLFINTVFGKGSTGKIVQDIGSVLEKNGHEYMVLYGRPPKTDDKHAVFVGGRTDAYVHCMMSRVDDGCGLHSTSATKKALKFIKEYKPDVIHLHNLHGYYINLPVLFSYLKSEYKGKIIWTLHDCWAFTGHCVHYTYAKCDRWKTGCFSCPEKKRYPSSFALDNSKKNYKIKKGLFTGLENMVIVTPSVWLKEQVQQSFLKEYKCVVVNNGIDLSVFSDKGKMKEGKYVINIIDGLDERKGYSDLIELSKRIVEKFETVLIGVKSNEVNGIPKSIKAICRTDSQEELAEYYRGASYLINTTYEDTFPTVNLEALACGTPVITYRSGGSPECLTPETGYIVNPGDVDQITSIVMSESVPSGTSCRKRALKYDKWKKFQEYLALYYSD